MVLANNFWSLKLITNEAFSCSVCMLCNVYASLIVCGNGEIKTDFVDIVNFIEGFIDEYIHW